MVSKVHAYKMIYVSCYFTVKYRHETQSITDAISDDMHAPQSRYYMEIMRKKITEYCLNRPFLEIFQRCIEKWLRFLRNMADLGSITLAVCFLFVLKWQPFSG